MCRLSLGPDITNGGRSRGRPGRRPGGRPGITLEFAPWLSSCILLRPLLQKGKQLFVQNDVI